MLTTDDLNLLRSSGFEAGPTGHAWYGTDKLGDVWRAYVEDTSDRLLFGVGIGNVWGPSKTMNREDFDEQFNPTR